MVVARLRGSRTSSLSAEVGRRLKISYQVDSYDPLAAWVDHIRRSYLLQVAHVGPTRPTPSPPRTSAPARPPPAAPPAGPRPAAHGPPRSHPTTPPTRPHPPAPPTVARHACPVSRPTTTTVTDLRVLIQGSAQAGAPVEDRLTDTEVRPALGRIRGFRSVRDVVARILHTTSAHRGRLTADRLSAELVGVNEAAVDNVRSSPR